MAYYLFDRQCVAECDPLSALRAIAMQLLHHNHNQPEVLDLARVMRDFSGSGEATIPEREVTALLGLILETLDEVWLVIDGLDECTEAHRLVCILNTATTNTRSRLLLISRPELDPTNTFSGPCKTLLLRETGNFDDIITFLQPGISRLVQDELLPIAISEVDATARSIATKSQGMFLWASTLFNYVAADESIMTPQDRLETMEDLCLLPEIGDLYDRILARVSARNRNKKAQMNLQRLLGWLCFSFRPMLAKELQVALAVIAGKETKKSQLIPRFEQAVVKMTGSLVEIALDGTVRFIHLSVLEFLTDTSYIHEVSSRQQEQQQQKSSFSLNPHTEHCRIAARCLSYLLFDGLKQRLVSTFGDEAGIVQIQRKYSLQLYATQFWAFHASKGLENWHTGLSSISDTLLQEIISDLAKLIFEFISDQTIVTVWTETAWRCQSAPSLDRLSDMVPKLSSNLQSHLSLAFADFAKDLARLESEWGHVLQDNPDEIWLPSIPAWLMSPFWVSTSDAKVVELGKRSSARVPTSPLTSMNAIIIATQNSRCGTEVGKIELRPSK